MEEPAQNLLSTVPLARESSYCLPAKAFDKDSTGTATPTETASPSMEVNSRDDGPKGDLNHPEFGSTSRNSQSTGPGSPRSQGNGPSKGIALDSKGIPQGESTSSAGSGLRRRAGAAGADDGHSAGGTSKESSSSSGERLADERSGGEVTRKKERRTVSSPIHTELRESPLSSDTIFRQSHAGLVNLCIVLLVAVNSRLIIENLLKYGILIRANFWFAVASWRDWPLVVCGVTLVIFPVNALLIEWFQLHVKVPDKAVTALRVINIAVQFLYPCVVILSLNEAQPLGCFNLIFITVIVMMKLISYAHVNYDLHRRLRSGERVEECAAGDISRRYPDNLTMLNMLYFLAAPTLCYQMSYPRTREIRKTFLVQQTIGLLSFFCLITIILEQYITPTIRNSKHPFQGHLVESVERVLRLSIPTLYVWLCMFFTFFHLWLNILAELLRFGDRDFYRDWWNAKTIEEYWRLWNMPVHRWMAKHIYFPFINSGVSRTVAMLVVFLLSAVFHEVLIGIPCRIFSLWAFLGMAFQIPLVFLTSFLYNKYKNPIVGNMLFWFFFCIVGQPACILLYYHDVQLRLRK